MKPFSSLFEDIERSQSTLYHITPTINIESILGSGLKRNSKRSTCGIETQSKIYLTTSLENIEDPFPHNYEWYLKDMSVLEVNADKIHSKLEIDPEYESGHFLMCDQDIGKTFIKNLGRYKFIQTENGFVGKKLIGEPK